MPISDTKERLICPFSPMLTTTMKWITCIGPKCQLWNEKKKDCGLKK